jgi:hypothetical protein
MPLAPNSFEGGVGAEQFNFPLSHYIGKKYLDYWWGWAGSIEIDCSIEICGINPPLQIFDLKCSNDR